MKGSFLVGVMKSIHSSLGLNYFDTIFSYSVGVFEQAFFASGQIETMEKTWCEYVHGTQLINYLNPLRGRPILDLDYLVDLFQSEKSLLDVSALNQSNTKLVAFVTDHETKLPTTLNLQEHDVFDVMRATCALPFFYPKKVLIKDKRYVDGWVSPVDKFRKFLENQLSGYDEVIGIITAPTDKRLEGLAKVIRPTDVHLRGSLDTNRERIIKMIRQGEFDGNNFIKNNRI